MAKPSKVSDLGRGSVVVRGVLFFVGGGMSYVMNTALFELLTTGLRWPETMLRFVDIEPLIVRGAGWPPTGAYAASLGSVIALSFLWSYYVNFRTSVAWHACAPRYITTVGACALLNYTIVQLLLLQAPTREKLIILIGMATAAGFKFLSYHFWVFPGGKPTGGEAPVAGGTDGLDG